MPVSPARIPQSYHYYLEEHFFRPCGIPSEHTAVPQGDAADPFEGVPPL